MAGTLSLPLPLPLARSLALFLSLSLHLSRSLALWLVYLHHCLSSELFEARKDGIFRDDIVPRPNFCTGTGHVVYG